jgi:hypothetical protein
VWKTAYKLKLPPHAQIQSVFHVSQLKPSIPDHTPVFIDIPTLPALDVVDVVPESILNRRLVKKGDSAVTQAHVQWSGLPAEMATWEDYYAIKARFPSTPAWGPAGSQGGGNVVCDG